MRLNSPWNPERDALVLAMLKKNQTFAEIAKALSKKLGIKFTRNMVAGRLRRMETKEERKQMQPATKQPRAAKLPKPPRKPKTRAAYVPVYTDNHGVREARSHNPIEARVRKHRISESLRRESNAVIAPLPKTAFVGYVPFATIAGKSRCKYSPHGTHLFCGANVPAGQSWCDEHKAVVFTKQRINKVSTGDTE